MGARGGPNGKLPAQHGAGHHVPDSGARQNIGSRFTSRRTRLQHQKPLLCLDQSRMACLHHSRVKGAATNTLHWWSGELTANYLAMQVALDFNTERKAGVAFFIVF